MWHQGWGKGGACYFIEFISDNDLREDLSLNTWYCRVQYLDSVQLSSVVQLYLNLRPHGLQHARLPCNSQSLLKLMSIKSVMHPTISSSVDPFSSCLQYLPASGSFSISQFFTSGGQNIGVSDSASVLPMNIQHWFPLGLTSLISFQSKGLSRISSNTTVQNHQFFSSQLCL